MNDRNHTVTFAITLPIAGLFDDQIKALRNARDLQAAFGNFNAAQALHTIMIMAEGGRHLFNTSVAQPIITVE